MRSFYSSICLLLSVLFIQCQKGIDPYDTAAPVPGIVTAAPIRAALQGNIIDDTGMPAEGVTIKVGNQAAITNSKGFFRIANALLDKNKALVTAEKVGFLKSYRVFSATAGSNQVIIKLIKKTIAGTIKAATGGEVGLTNGAKVKLPVNGVVNAASGTAYTGDVRVFVSYIDPTQSDIATTIPGSFLANDKNGKTVTLTSYGMMAVELESATGEKLQVKPGVKAVLTTPIPQTILGQAPATIALWSVDEKTGIWKEEGTATKQGNIYVGEVAHFSFWNCDVSIDAVQLSLSLRNSKGLPVVHTRVKITRGNSGWFSYGMSDSLGHVSGFVPGNETLLLQILDPCDNVIYTKNILPLNGNTNLGVVNLPELSNYVVTLSGTLSDCSNTPVTNGYAIINFNNEVRYAAVGANGAFSVSFIKCSGSAASVKIIAVNNTTLQQGNEQEVMLTSNSVNAGNLVACGTSSAAFINYAVDGTNYSIKSETGDSLLAGVSNFGSGNSVYISGFKISPLQKISFAINNVNATGTFPIQSLYVNDLDSIQVIRPLNVTITTFPNSVGGFFEGSFSGKFTVYNSPAQHTISANFRVRRDN